MATKSLLKHPRKLSLERAKKAHDCQSGKHRLQNGDLRLKVFTDPRSPDYYCLKCALEIIEADISRLAGLKKELVNELETLQNEQQPQI